MFAKTFAAAAAAFALAGTAQAATLYDNGAPQGGGLEVTLDRVLNDFTLSAATNLTGAGVYLSRNVSEGWDGAFQYSIWSSNEGSPGEILAQGSADITPVEVDNDPFGFPVFLFQFDFASAFKAEAGVTYFLGVHAAADYDRRAGIFWVATDDNGTLNAQDQSHGTGAMAAINQENSFFLTGDAVSAAPEPQSWALMIMGFGAAGAMLRRRQGAPHAI